MSKSPNLIVVLNISGSDEKRIEAFKLYQRTFNAKNLSGDFIPDESGEVHIMMEINGIKFGIFPGQDYNSRGNISCQFEFETEDELRKAYEILSHEAQEHSIETAFWCKLFAFVTDKFGIFWCLCVPN
jgi:uncharacterized glyoxalase superfamily protein PhnB